MCYIPASDNGASLQSAGRQQGQGDGAGTSQSTGDEFFSEQRLHELLLVQELEFQTASLSNAQLWPSQKTIFTLGNMEITIELTLILTYTEW